MLDGAERARDTAARIDSLASDFGKPCFSQFLAFHISTPQGQNFWICLRTLHFRLHVKQTYDLTTTLPKHTSDDS